MLFALAYSIAPISGANVSPAVTLGLVFAKKLSVTDALWYVLAQFLGAIGAAALLATFVSSFGVTDYTGGLGTNAYDNGAINLTGAFVLEVILTAVFVLVILLVTEKVANSTMAGAAIGLTLTLVHIVGIPLTGTSLNPVRSFGPALFAGGEALSQVWLFIAAPLVGAVVAWGLWKLIRVESD